MRFAGMAGACVGLEWSAMLSVIPADADRERVLALAREWETGMIEGAGEKAKRERKE